MLTCVENVRSTFHEDLQDFFDSELKMYTFEKNYHPIPGREILEVDYFFLIKPKPLFLFGVNDNEKAMIVSKTCLEFIRKNISFLSVVVHEDFEVLARQDRKVLTNIVDKQFPDLQSFKQMARKYFERES